MDPVTLALSRRIPLSKARSATSVTPRAFLDARRGYVHLVAHRGAFEAPENTIVGLSTLPRLCKGAEFDVRFTSDGVPVILHDSTVDRTTDGTGAINTLTLAQVKALDAGSWYHPIYAGTRIPTLLEYLQAARLLNFSMMLLDLKEADTPQKIERIRNDVIAAHMQDRVIVLCQNAAQMDAWREVDDTLRVGFLNATTSNIDSYLDRCIKYGGEIIFLSLGSSGWNNNRSIIPAIKAEGILVGGSTVNESADVDKFIVEDGLDVLMTDGAGMYQRLVEVRSYA